MQNPNCSLDYPNAGTTLSHGTWRGQTCGLGNRVIPEKSVRRARVLSLWSESGTRHKRISAEPDSALYPLVRPAGSAGTCWYGSPGLRTVAPVSLRALRACARAEGLCGCGSAPRHLLLSVPPACGDHFAGSAATLYAGCDAKLSASSRNSRHSPCNTERY